MKEKIRKNLKKYGYYILIFVIVCLLIVIGFIYSESVTNKYSNDINIEVEEEKEIIEEKQTFFVDIKGEVKNPGVYELEENKRIIDVIKMAGGLTKNASTDYINLSKKIKDEMVIIIYSKKEIEDYNKNESEQKEIIKYQIIEKECVCPNAINDACISENDDLSSNENVYKEEKEINNSTEENNDDNKLVNINSATIDELTTISGLGEKKAEAIIEYRKENKFTTIEDIKNVSGIGEALFEKIKDYITV